jgi:hypothetical protein
MDQVRDAINAVDTDLQSEKEELAKTDGVGGSSLIGTPVISGVTGTTVKDQLASLKGAIDQTSLGQIVDGSLTDVKLSDTAGQIKDRFSKHVADRLYQTAGGTATAIALTISETLVNGLPITFIASANNGGAATTINGNPIYKPNTIIAPTLISGKAYTVWYSSAGTCFFIKASAEGTATTAQVLAGVPFSNETDTGLIGTMPNRDNLEVNSSIAPYMYNGSLYMKPPEGYYDGDLSRVKYSEANLIPPNILSGKTIFGVAGTATGFIAGSILWASVGDGGQNHGSFSIPTMVHEIKINNCGGVVRTEFGFIALSPSNTVNARIYVNGVARGTQRSLFNSGSYVNFQEDISFNAGDLIQLYMWCTPGVDQCWSNGLRLYVGVTPATYTINK